MCEERFIAAVDDERRSEKPTNMFCVFPSSMSLRYVDAGGDIVSRGFGLASMYIISVE